MSPGGGTGFYFVDASAKMCLSTHCDWFSFINFTTHTMSRICAITGKRPKTGGKIIYKCQRKKAGGIGLQLVKTNKRVFRPNLQRIRVKLPNGSVKRLWVSVKAIKAGKVEKA
jgi:large subunit ribosomal protein L28